MYADALFHLKTISYIARALEQESEKLISNSASKYLLFDPVAVTVPLAENMGEITFLKLLLIILLLLLLLLLRSSLWICTSWL